MESTERKEKNKKSYMIEYHLTSLTHEKIIDRTSKVYFTDKYHHRKNPGIAGKGDSHRKG